METFRTFRTLLEGKKFHPIDVFQERWVITDGKDIINPESGAIYLIAQYKKMMKNLKKHDQYDDVFYPTEKMAEQGFKELGSDKNYKIKKLSYA